MGMDITIGLIFILQMYYTFRIFKECDLTSFASLNLKFIMSKIFNGFRQAIFFMLLFVLLVIYANLPEYVGTYSNQAGEPAGLVSRNTFFYLALLMIVVVNGVLLTLINLDKKNPDQTPEFKEAKHIWLHGITSLINLFFIVSIIFYNAFNSLEHLNIAYYGYSVYMISGISVLWIFGLFFVIQKRGK